MWALLQQSFGVVFNPVTLIYLCVGTIVGVVMGAMPGVSASMAVVIAMTFSYAMEPLPAIALLVCVYCAAITGGGISAILFSIPGTDTGIPRGRQPDEACFCLCSSISSADFT